MTRKLKPTVLNDAILGFSLLLFNFILMILFIHNSDNQTAPDHMEKRQ